MNYPALARMVSGKLSAFGMTLTYTRTPRTVSGVAGTATAGTATSYANIPAIVLPASKGTVEAFDNRRDDGSLKGMQLRYLKIAAQDLAIEPVSGDHVFFASKDWLVLGCTPVDPSQACPLVYGIGVVAT